MKYLYGILLIVLGLAFGEEPNVKMKVEEPELGKATAPAQPEKDAALFAQQDLQQGLTPEQRKAMEERKQKTRELAELIREKRKAIREADPDTKQRLTEDFQKMLLDRKGDNATSEGSLSVPKSETDNKGSEKKIEQREIHDETKQDGNAAELKQLQNEKMQKWREFKQKELEKIKESESRSGEEEKKSPVSPISPANPFNPEKGKTLP